LSFRRERGEELDFCHRSLLLTPCALASAAGSWLVNQRGRAVQCWFSFSSFSFSATNRFSASVHDFQSAGSCSRVPGCLSRTRSHAALSAAVAASYSVRTSCSCIGGVYGFAPDRPPTGIVRGPARRPLESRLPARRCQWDLHRRVCPEYLRWDPGLRARTGAPVRSGSFHRSRPKAPGLHCRRPK
jgi:hypothetical protein